MTREEIMLGHALPHNAGRKVLNQAEANALAEYWRVKGDPQREQAAVIALAKLGLASNVEIDG